MTALERAERIEEREMSTLKAKKQMLGNIRFVGELYKLEKMLPEQIAHFCIQKLLGVTNEAGDGTFLVDASGAPYFQQISELTAADEFNIEALANLFSIIGSKLESEALNDQTAYKAQLMNLYLTRISDIENDSKFPSRIRFMLKDLFAGRRNNHTQQPVQSAGEDSKFTQKKNKKTKQAPAQALATMKPSSSDVQPKNVKATQAPTQAPTNTKPSPNDIELSFEGLDIKAFAQSLEASLKKETKMIEKARIKMEKQRCELLTQVRKGVDCLNEANTFNRWLSSGICDKRILSETSRDRRQMALSAVNHFSNAIIM
jgi:hypothetical protein